jgi:hypothetical protein
MDKQFDVILKQEEKRLTILEDGKPVGGFKGDIAIRMYKKIAYNNAKIEVKDGNVQVAV